ncbi:MAG TPA: formate dehydrogenase accessory sulfurtransferase FdhD [Longimicrobiales bacterium]
MPGRAGAVAERPVRLEVNGRALESWTASPGLEQALAAGHLLAEGYIRRRSDVVALDVLDDGGLTVIRAHVDVGGAVMGEERRALRASGGFPALLAYLRQRAADPVTTRAPLPELISFPTLFRELFGGADTARETGGQHSAALSNGETLKHRVEEVARHSAVDKALGAALLAGDDLSALGLVISARVSGEMALKCAEAGLAWIASRSVPTTLAVEVAEAAGMPIVARAASSEPTVFGARETRS